MYVGDITAGQVVYFNFTTVDSTGAPATLSGTPAIKIYKNDDTAESTAGRTLTVDFDGRTGLNNVKIDTSADGTFYAAGNDFGIILTSGTVGGVSVVGYEVGTFSIENRNVKVNVTKVDGTALTSHASGKLPADVLTVAGTSQTARDLGASVLLSSGTGTGQVDLSSGQVKVQQGTSAGQLDTSSGQVKVQSGTGSGQLDVTSGVVTSRFGPNGLRKNAAFTALPFVMRDDTTRLPATGLTVAVQRSIDGGSFGTGGLTNITEVGNGVYTVDGIAGDVNGNYITFRATATGADPTIFVLTTVP